MNPPKVGHSSPEVAGDASPDSSRKSAEDQRLAGGSDDPEATEHGTIWEDPVSAAAAPGPKWPKYLRWAKIVFLLICWLVLTVLLFFNAEYDEELFMFQVPTDGVMQLNLQLPVRDKRLGVKVLGAFEKHTEASAAELKNGIKALTVEVECESAAGKAAAATAWMLPFIDAESLENEWVVQRQHVFTFPDMADGAEAQDTVRVLIKFRTNVAYDVPLEASVQLYPVPSHASLVYSLLLMIGMYSLFVIDAVHRTFAAILWCTMAIGVLAVLEARPSIGAIMNWVDVDTLMLLFGTTIIVTIFADTGLHEHLAVLGYELANGHIWPILNCMFVVSATLSSLMDNIVVLLVVSPFTIRISEVIQLNPVPVMICVIVAANIGAVLTPMGNDALFLMVGDYVIAGHGITWGVFLLHVTPGVFVALFAAWAYLRIYYWNSDKMRFYLSPEEERLLHVIRVWKMAARSVSTYSKGEQEMRTVVNTKVRSLRNRLKRMAKKPLPTPDYEENLRTLKANYPIRNRTLLIKCSAVFVLVVVGFIYNSVPQLYRIENGWIAVIGAFLLLIIADIEDLEGILARMEWATMLFFTGLYAFTKALVALGMFTFIGDKLSEWVAATDEEWRLALAIVLILWVSALCSAFLVNIAVCQMMVAVIYYMAQESDLKLPVQPLVWALVLGVCFGGNGSLVGATANVVGAGTVERHGYTFSFLYFLRVGMPVMFVTVITATIYLLIAHCYFQWH